MATDYYLVSVDQNLSESEYEDAKKHIEEQNIQSIETISDRTSIIGPLFKVKFKDGLISTFKAHKHIKAVELDGPVTTRALNGGKVKLV